MLLTNILKSELKRIDNEWIKRSRKLTTQTIFSYMTEAYIRKIGIKHIINERKEMIPICPKDLRHRSSLSTENGNDYYMLLYIRTKQHD